jgi:hypothetical protein
MTDGGSGQDVFERLVLSAVEDLRDLREKVDDLFVVVASIQKREYDLPCTMQDAIDHSVRKSGQFILADLLNESRRITDLQARVKMVERDTQDLRQFVFPIKVKARRLLTRAFARLFSRETDETKDQSERQG